MVDVMRGVWRVLRDDGVAWVVLGDSFNGANNTQVGDTRGGRDGIGLREASNANDKRDGLSPGNLLLIPARVALALQADGWTLRQVVTWAKVAPMPESVAGTRWERCRVKVASAPVGSAAYRTGAGGDQGPHGDTITDRVGAEWRDCPGCPNCADTGGYVLRRGSWRHTSATEQVLMLAKGMGYWADQEAVREAASDTSWWAKQRAAGVDTWAMTRPVNDNAPNNTNGQGGTGGNPAGRNPRNWVTPSPLPFSGAHFATYPPKLIEPFIKATCPAKCCPVCGAGWAPVVERGADNRQPYATVGAGPYSIGSGRKDGNGLNKVLREDGRGGSLATARSTVLGYRPTCACPPADPVPGTVLDPFLGAGTTALVADRLGRDCIGIELNAEYAKIAEARIHADAGMFAEVSS